MQFYEVLTAQVAREGEMRGRSTCQALKLQRVRAQFNKEAVSPYRRRYSSRQASAKMFMNARREAEKPCPRAHAQAQQF